MCNRSKQTLKLLPTFFLVGLIILSGGLKISGYHPMILHFVELRISDYLFYLGAAEIAFALLFLFPGTARIGLLLLTAYFGGAIAIEIPFRMMAGPAIPLVLIWIAAFIRQPLFFLDKQKQDSRRVLAGA